MHSTLCWNREECEMTEITIERARSPELCSTPAEASCQSLFLWVELDTSLKLQDTPPWIFASCQVSLAILSRKKGGEMNAQ